MMRLQRPVRRLRVWAPQGEDHVIVIKEDLMGKIGQASI